MQGTENRADQEKKIPGAGEKKIPARFGTLLQLQPLGGSTARARFRAHNCIQQNIAHQIWNHLPSCEFKSQSMHFDVDPLPFYCLSQTSQVQLAFNTYD